MWSISPGESGYFTENIFETDKMEVEKGSLKVMTGCSQ
jgi:hypothetical protein